MTYTRLDMLICQKESLLIADNSVLEWKHLLARNIVFRKEDINMMSFRGVNSELGHNKQNYSLLKFKGGKNCHHYWELRVYKKKGNKLTDPNSAYEKGLKEPKNPSEMGERMIDRG